MSERHPGAVYGASKNKAPGSKQFYRPTYSGGKWDQFVIGHAVGRILQVCCGGSSIGQVRVDIDATVPGVTVQGSMLALPFRDGAFETVCCDPMYNLGNPERIHLQRELARVATARLLFKAPWIPRASGWELKDTILIASHTCANVAVLSRLDKAAAADGFFDEE